jgi:outer membrane protein OmpA-like peptidoglycan-associated protein
MRTFAATLRLAVVGLLTLALGLGAGACSSLSNTEKGAIIGAGGGAAAGGAIGKATGDTAKGAIIGAVVGGAAGAIIGQQMDRQADDLDDDLEGADVTRVGEGIEVTFDSALLFDFDSAELRRNARQNLRELAESLENYPRTDILIVGHTDATGPEDYNQELSEDRARAAAAFLYDQGIRPDRVETLGRGESEPVATNDTEAGRQQNRRVEVAIYASEEMREDAREQAQNR